MICHKIISRIRFSNEFGNEAQNKDTVKKIALSSRMSLFAKLQIDQKTKSVSISSTKVLLYTNK